MDGWLDGWYFTHRYDDDNNDDEIVQGKGRGGGGCLRVGYGKDG